MERWPTLFAFYMFVDLWRFAHGQNGRRDLFSNHFGLRQASGVTPFIFGCHEMELSFGSRELEGLFRGCPHDAMKIQSGSFFIRVSSLLPFRVSCPIYHSLRRAGAGGGGEGKKKHDRCPR